MRLTSHWCLQGAQKDGILEFCGIAMGFFLSLETTEKPGNIMRFFHQSFNFFSKLVILISYLLENSPA